MRNVRLATAIVSLLALSACSNVAPVEQTLAAQVKSKVLREVTGSIGPKDIAVEAMWHGGGDPASTLICGEFDAAPELREKQRTLRFISDQQSKYTQVEFHELWVGASMTMMLVEQNRMIFDGIWSEHCAPFSPNRKWWRLW